MRIVTHLDLPLPTWPPRADLVTSAANDQAHRQPPITRKHRQTIRRSTTKTYRPSQWLAAVRCTDWLAGVQLEIHGDDLPKIQVTIIGDATHSMFCEVQVFVLGIRNAWVNSFPNSLVQPV